MKHLRIGFLTNSTNFIINSTRINDFAKEQNGQTIKQLINVGSWEMRADDGHALVTFHVLEYIVHELIRRQRVKAPGVHQLAAELQQ